MYKHKISMNRISRFCFIFPLGKVELTKLKLLVGFSFISLLVSGSLFY